MTLLQASKIFFLSKLHDATHTIHLLHIKIVQETPTEQYLKCVTVVALILVLFWFPLCPPLSALRILACATAQVWCHPSACHWTDGDVFALRGAVYVEYDEHAKMQDGSIALFAQQLSYQN